MLLDSILIIYSAMMGLVFYMTYIIAQESYHNNGIDLENGSEDILL